MPLSLFKKKYINSWEHGRLYHTVSLLRLSSNSLQRSESAETNTVLTSVLLVCCATVGGTEAKATKFLQLFQ